MKVLEIRGWKIYDCKLCNAKLEALPSDVKSHYDWEGDVSAWIECPICGCKEYLKHNETPPKATKK